MKKYEAMSKNDNGIYEEDAFFYIEAEDEQEALDIYLDFIADNLNVFDAKRIDDGRYKGEASFQYYTDSDDEHLTTLDIKMQEVEEDE